MKTSTRLALAVAVVLAGAAGASAADKEAKTPAAKADAVALARTIDQAVEARLAAEKLTPAPLADDAEFLRRAYLDLVGVIPPADKAAAFLDSKEPDKRAKLIDDLLASPQFGRHFADVWQALLLPRNSDNRRLQAEPMVKWLEQNFNDNTPWDKLATDLVTATGSQDKNGAATFYLANQSVDKVTDQVTKLFLGVRLECAQCHNHPFTGWKQTEYWGMAQFFMKVKADNVNKAAKDGTSAGVTEEGKGKGLMKPESAKTVPAKFLQGEEPKLKPSEPYRPVLATWLTAPENPFFAKAMVNRTWAHFFGRGLVNPIDDMHDANLASHPELLKELSASFAGSGFDLKDLMRAVCNSKTYQRTSKGAGEEASPQLFRTMAVKVLTPEQLFDSLEAVLGPAGRGGDGPRKAQAAQRPGGNTPRAQFVAFFQVDENADPTDYQTGIPQALRLMNSAQMNNGGTLLAQAAKAKDSTQAVEQIFLATLARRPTAEESQKLTAYVAKASDSRKGYNDVIWAVLNSSEFTLCH